VEEKPENRSDSDIMDGVVELVSIVVLEKWDWSWAMSMSRAGEASMSVALAG
jgi:hypothetical protein